mmetsp:Transcript_52053/g.52429  ORF Transcript_52053/g.52429 Transcript_52053/m.52429 type:complete len:115 (-) Transcript_52053:1197-1541(-)
MSSSKTENRNAPNADEIRIVPVSETFHHINEERKIDVDDGAVIRSSKEKLNEFLEKSDFELLMRERAKVRLCIHKCFHETQSRKVSYIHFFCHNLFLDCFCHVERSGRKKMSIA